MDALAIRLGLRMVYRHRNIDRNFLKNTVGGSAFIAVWQACTCGQCRGGAIPEVKDCKLKSKNIKKKTPFVDLWIDEFYVEMNIIICMELLSVINQQLFYIYLR